MFCFASQAQSAQSLLSQYSLTSDSVTNQIHSPYLSTAVQHQIVGFQPIITVTTGSLSATLSLQVSNDNTNWNALSSYSVAIAGQKSTDGAIPYFFTLAPGLTGYACAQYYRIQTVSTTSCTAVQTCKVYTKGNR